MIVLAVTAQPAPLPVTQDERDAYAALTRYLGTKNPLDYIRTGTAGWRADIEARM